jgi:hypothetical protein
MAGLIDYGALVQQLMQQGGGGLLGNVAMKNKPLDKGMNPIASSEGAIPSYGGGPFKGTLYHGTNTPFEKVDMKKGAMGTFWVTSDKAGIAKGESGASGTKHVLPFEVNVKNPAGWKEYEKYSTGELISMGFDSVILPSKGGHFDAILFHPGQAKRIK